MSRDDQNSMERRITEYATYSEAGFRVIGILLAKIMLQIGLACI
jgi:hypothetical protein